MALPPLPPLAELTVDTFYDWARATGSCEPGCRPRGAPHPAPAATTEDLGPRTWDDYIGQRAVVTELEVRVAAAARRGDGLPPVLLCAPPGSGKTTVARLIAVHLGRPLVVIDRPCNPTALAKTILAAGPQPVVLVDEVHLWGKTAQHDLMDLADRNLLHTSDGPVELPGISLVLATTNPERLVGPLVSRIACQPRFERYTDDDMDIMVAAMAYRAGLEPEQVTRTFSRLLGRAAAGSPRAARHLVLAAVDLHLAGHPCTAEAVLNFTGTDHDGMTDLHLRYLEALTQHQRPLGIPTLAQLLGAAPDQVTRLEELLLRDGYITLTASGRQITPAGTRRYTA